MWAQGNQWNQMPLDAAAYQNMNHELGNPTYLPILVKSNVKLFLSIQWIGLHWHNNGLG